jgi:hypothetical protein
MQRIPPLLAFIAENSDILGPGMYLAPRGYRLGGALCDERILTPSGRFCLRPSLP